MAWSSYTTQRSWKYHTTSFGLEPTGNKEERMTKTELEKELTKRFNNMNMRWEEAKTYQG